MITGNPRVMVAIPTKGQVHAKCFQAVMQLAGSKYVYTQGCSVGMPSCWCRNNIVKTFLADKTLTHIFMLDSDMDCPPDAVDKLLALDAPIAAGVYPMWAQGAPRWSFGNYAEGLDSIFFSKELEKTNIADAVGTGIILIRRDVFEKIPHPWFQWRELNGHQVSDDVFFAHKYRDAGYRVAIDQSVICNHYKEMNLLTLVDSEIKGDTPEGDINTEDRIVRMGMKMKGHIFENELRRLYNYGKQVPTGQIIVEIGSLQGRSTTALLAGSAFGNNVPVYAIDPMVEWNQGGLFVEKDTRAKFFENMCNVGLIENLRLINLKSWDAYPAIKHNKIGLLFIDGNHEYQSVKEDYDTYAFSLADDGIVIFHDTNDTNWGVRQLIDELIGIGEIEIIEAINTMKICKRRQVNDLDG